MSTDAIVLLKDDHKQIRKLFRDFQDAGANATKTKATVVDKILEELGERMLELKKAPRSPSQPGSLKKAVDAVLD